MLVIGEVKCPYCGAMTPTFSGGFINKPATTARCPICKKEFKINPGIFGRLKRFLTGHD